MDRCLQNDREQARKLRWPSWADAIVEADPEWVEARMYDEGEAFPYCILCGKWSPVDHITSRLHERRKRMLEGSRFIEPSSLCSETCNALSAAEGVIHSNIAQEVASVQAATVHSKEKKEWEDWAEWQRRGWRWC